jgi:hypothetical protein
MTEILGSEQPEPDPWQRPVADEDRYDLSPEPATDVARDPAAPPLSGARRLLHAFGEAGSLAVGAVLGVLAAVAVGPRYRFDTYPFNQGLDSIREFFTLNQAGAIHPLRTYLVNVAPTALLVLTAVVAGLLALARAESRDPAWARPVAAGAVLAGIALAILVVVGAWHTSTLDLTVPPGQ